MDYSNLPAVIALLFIVITFFCGLPFIHKYKPIRYVSHSLCALMICVVAYFYNAHKTYINTLNNSFIGIYKLDTVNSRLKNRSISEYTRVSLEVKGSGVFIITPSIPFFRSHSGTWQLTEFDSTPYLEYHLYDERSTDSTIQPPQLFISIDSSINGPQLDTGDRIIFKK